MRLCNDWTSWYNFTDEMSDAVSCYRELCREIELEFLDAAPLMFRLRGLVAKRVIGARKTHPGVAAEPCSLTQIEGMPWQGYVAVLTQLREHLPFAMLNALDEAVGLMVAASMGRDVQMAVTG